MLTIATRIISKFINYFRLSFVMIGKKGSIVESRPFLFLFDVLIVIVILMSVAYYFRANSDDTNFKQSYYARDIALISNGILSSKGDVIVNYILEEDFLVKIDDVLGINSFKEFKSDSYNFPLKDVHIDLLSFSGYSL